MLQLLNSYSCLALAVTSDGNIDQLGDGDDGDLGVQDDAKQKLKFQSQIPIFNSKKSQKTYSEAMLISGASKQISCAIFYIFDLIIY